MLIWISLLTILSFVLITWIESHIIEFIHKFLYKPKESYYAHFKDNLSRTIFYHGVNISNYQKHSIDRMPWHKKEDILRLKEWGFNLVRFLVFWERIEPKIGQYNTDYLQSIEKFVGMLQEVGIDVIIDIHQDLYAQKFGGNGFPEWSINDGGHEFNHREPWNRNYLEPSVRSSYKSFWKSSELKLKYMNVIELLIKKMEKFNNVIGIDVMNEPFPTSINVFKFESRTLSEFYLRINQMFIDTKSNIRMFYEPEIATSAGLPTYLDFNATPTAVFIPHYYDPWCHYGKPYKKFNKWLMKRSLEIKARESQIRHSPFIIGEFGLVPSDTHLSYIEDFLNHMERLQGNWIWWSYDKERDSGHALVDNKGGERSCLTGIVRIYAQKVYGNNIRVTRDQNSYTIRYDGLMDDAIPTEIFIPKNINYKVKTEGKFILEGQTLKYYNTHKTKQEIIIKLK